MADFKCLVFVLLLYLFDNVRSDSLLCDAAFCRTFLTENTCPPTAPECRINNATHSGLTLPSPTPCNCCEYCLPLYVEGEHCSLGGPGTGTTIGRCGDGLTCAVDPTDDETRCTRMKSTCHALQDEFDTREANGQIGALEERPVCDGKGRFGPVHCTPAQTCVCQSEEGKRIFGESLYLGSATKQNMHCGCSRLHEKIQRSISTGVRWPVVGPRCTDDGNFNPIQCFDRTCYCVDPLTGFILPGIETINLDTQPITRLECYTEELDLFPQYSEGRPPYTYTTPCFEEIKDKIEVHLTSEEDGYNIDFGGGITECYLDGTYGRFAYTRDGMKVCVDNRGRQIGDFKAVPGTDDYYNMDCKCAITSNFMGDSTEKPVCCKNGNFRRIQCRRGLCHCVDADGRQTSRETATVNALMPCFTQDWRTC